MMHRREVLTTMLGATAALAITRTAVAQITPAGAIPSSVYLQMATTGGMFLENTARDAHEKTRNPAVKKFSRAEVIEQVNLSRKLGTYTGGAPMAVAPAGPGGLIGGLVAAPVAVAGAAVGTAGGVAGGVLGIAPPPGGMTTDAQKAQILSQLTAMAPGPQYDATFVADSLQGHQEALAIHGSYAQSGEDPGLRRIARGALPLIQLHISQLSQMQGRAAG
jgi:predicted outer membrane protein